MSTHRSFRIAIAFALILVTPTVYAQAAARPDWKVGDTWTVGITTSGFGGAGRRDEVRVVKEVAETGYQVENTKKEGGATSVETLNLSRDLNLIAASQEFKWLQWPLEPGRAIQFEVTGTNQVVTWKGKVVGWEEVEVPAGKFKALRVEFDRSGQLQGSASESVWYAPEAKAVVKRVQMRPGSQRTRDLITYELVAYKLN